MTATLSLGGTPLALPARDGGVQIERTPIGSADRMLDGTLRVDYRTVKAKITISWTGLTAAEQSAIVTAWTAAIGTSKTLILPDTQTFSVMAGLNPLTEPHWYDIKDTPYYDGLTCIFEEV